MQIFQEKILTFFKRKKFFFSISHKIVRKLLCQKFLRLREIFLKNMQVSWFDTFYFGALWLSFDQKVALFRRAFLENTYKFAPNGPVDNF